MKPMSAAEYAAHAESVESQQPTEVRKLKSGSVFELRRPDLQRMVVLGLIPQSLLDEGVSAWEKSGIKAKTAIPHEVSAQTAKSGLILMREIVAYACVTPPFNEVTAKHFLREDFDEIYHWAMRPKESATTEGVRSFRKGRKGRTARAKPDSEKLQPETVSTAAN